MRMSLTLDREIGHYEVLDLVLEHNHALYLPKTFHLMLNISYLHAFEIETVNDSGIGQTHVGLFAAEEAWCSAKP
jgi:hypothetical protein